MSDWNKLVLGEEDSQTAPVCNGTVREMIADINRLKRYENIYHREFEAKQQLKAAEFEITELNGALSEVKRQLDASQALLAEARTEVEALTDCLIFRQRSELKCYAMRQFRWKRNSHRKNLNRG